MRAFCTALTVAVSLLSLSAMAAAQVDGFDFPVGYPDGTGWSNGSDCVAPSCTDDPCIDGLTFLEPYDYGDRIECILHPGDDWNIPGVNDCGEPVHAVANGQVIAVPEDCNWGTVVIRHDDVPGFGTLWSVYGHMDAAAVPLNANVTRGDVIGSVSNKLTPSCHLHFEIRKVDLHPCYFPTQAEIAGDPLFITSRYLNPTEFINANRPRVETRLTFDGARSINAKMVCDDNRCYIVWQDDRDGNWEIYFTTVSPTGTKLISDKRITYTSENSISPDIGTDGTGRSFIVWQDGSAIVFNILDSDGSRTIADVTVGTGNVRRPAIASHDDGTSTIVWERSESVFRRLYLCKYDDSGSLLCGGCDQLSPGDIIGYDKNADVSLDPLGNAYVTWFDIYDFQDGIWVAKQNLDCNVPINYRIYPTGEQPNVATATPATDWLFCMFEMPVGGYPQIHCWEGNDMAVDISNSSGSAQQASCASIDPNECLVVWQDTRDGNPEIYLRKTDGYCNVTTDPIRLTRNPHRSESPCIAINDAGDWFVVWQDDRDGNFELYWTPGSVTPALTQPQITDLLDAGTGSDLVVKWTQPNKTGVTDYQVYFGLAPGDYVFQSVLIPEDGSNEYSFPVNGLTEHIPYYVAVRAYNADTDLWSTYAEAGPLKPTIPVVLVHGVFLGSTATWDDPSTSNDFRGWLEGAGFNLIYPAPLAPCGYTDETHFGSNAEALALLVNGYIHDLEGRAQNHPPITRVDIVAHSMGGLVSRRMIAPPEEFNLSVQVRNLIMLGTPNGGTSYANLGCVSWWPGHPLGELICTGPAFCELGSIPMQDFNGWYKQPDSTIFSAVAGNIYCAGLACRLQLGCYFTGCVHDGRVSKNSVFGIDLDNWYTRGLTHSDLPMSPVLVFQQLVLPILLGTPPPSDMKLASSGPDSTLIQVIAGILVLPDSVDWTADTITIPPAQSARFWAAPFSSEIEVELEDPTGTVIDSTVAMNDTANFQYISQSGLVSFSVNAPIPGDWIVKVRAFNWQDTVAPVLVFAQIQNDVQLTFYDYNPEGELQDSVILRARLDEAGSPILGCTVDVQAFLDRDTVSGSLSLLDDGSGADEQPDDGIYSGVFTETQVPGFYSFKCQVDGLNSLIEPFTRFAVLQTYVVGHARGDMNADGVFDIFDVVLLVNFAFRGGPPPYPEFMADVNCDGTTADVFDIVRLVDTVFRRAPEPSCP